jgi:hypothetical protein
MEFTELFKPIKLGTLELKIGSARAPRRCADINGYITENAVLPMREGGGVVSFVLSVHSRVILGLQRPVLGILA